MAKASMLGAAKDAPRLAYRNVALSGFVNVYKRNGAANPDPIYTIGPCIYSSEPVARRHVSLTDYKGRARVHVGVKRVDWNDNIPA